MKAGPHFRRARVTRSVFGTSLTAIALAIAQGAAAQDSNPPPPAPQAVCPTAEDANAPCPPAPAVNDAAIEEIVVRGVRSSVTSAIGIKENSIEIVDSIVAEDIGKLPDNSVAAALQRVTGVQVARGNGEVNTVLIRGLPDVVTTMNGRNVFTTTGRGIALADIPADLLQRVDVYKTTSAEQPEGGIAGTIDVRLHRPFDFDGLTIAGGIRGVYSEQAEKTDPVGSLTLSDRWATDYGEFGALISGSYQQRHFQESNTFNGTYDFIDNPAAPTPDDSSDDIYRPLTIGSIYNIGDRDRASTNVSLQWRPNAQTEVYFDGFYVGYDQTSELNFWIPLPVIVNSGNVESVTLKPGTNVAQQMVARDMFTLTSNQAFKNSSDTYQAALGGSWEDDGVKLSTDLSYTYSTATNRSFILDTWFNAPLLTMNFGTVADALVTNADGSAFDVADSSHYYLDKYFDAHSRQDGQDYAWKAEGLFDVDFGPINRIEAGVRLDTRTAINRAADTGVQNNISGNTIAMDSIAGLASVTPDNLLDGAHAVSTPQWVVADRDFLLNHSDTIRTALGHEAGAPPLLPSLYFNDQEDNYAAYGQAYYETAIGSLPVDGFVGARIVQLNSKLEGTLVSDGVASPVDVDKNDTQVLPTVNARFKFLPDLFLRASYGKTITRPAFAQLNPQLSLFISSGNTTRNTGSGGNPDLDSVKSDNYDLALEWYFSRGSLLSATGFYRAIDGYIQTYSTLETIDGIQYDVSRPRNTGSGSLAGLELNYVQFFDMLPGWLSGFGAQLNATFIDAQTESPDGVDQDLVNVSKQAYNAILMYEKYGFSARFAYNWRSKYVTAYNPGGSQTQEIDVAATDNLDALLSYDVNEHLTIALEATNLLNETTRNYFGDASLYPRDFARLERTYSAGVRFRF